MLSAALMESSIFGHIPCPAGSRCTASKCLFGHDERRKPAAEKFQEPQEPVSAYQDATRKRAKVGENGASVERQTAGYESNEYENEKPTTIAKTVSPPPLRRLATHSPRALSSSKSTSLRKPVTKTSTPKVPQKPETLNPRLLKHSPASHEMRHKLLKLLHTEYQRLNKELQGAATFEDRELFIQPQGLIVRALDEEQKAATEKPAIYMNVMRNRIMMYKKMDREGWRSEREKETPKSQETKKRRDMGDEPRKIETGLSPTLEVEILRRILTPIDHLSQHGYVSTIPSELNIQKARDGKEASQGWEKCDRCQQRFQVFPGRRASDGALTSGGTCTFHWGKTYIPTKAVGDKTRRAKRYQCCGEDVGDSVGCFSKDHHVYKVNAPNMLATTLNFEHTPQNKGIPEDRAVAFDCEMAYTVHGLELIRLTAVSWPKGEAMLDVLVRPIGEILDLNSRFSGIWPKDMARAKPWTSSDSTPSKSGSGSESEDGEVSKKNLSIVSSPVVARDLLFSLLSPSTPLIGHGLENDLNAVRIIHPTLIDTVLLYPHKGGLPFRYGLRNLMEQHLNRRIQQDKAGGHDSAEDAMAAGELVRLRVQEEWENMKRLGWRVSGQSLVPPGA